MNWGHKIIIAFILFGTFIVTLVVVCVREDFQLVSSDYYQQTLDFENQIIRAKNAQDLAIQPELIYSKSPRQLELVFTLEVSESINEGDVTFFRPSNAAMDFNTQLTLDNNGRQTVDLTDHVGGLWKVKLSWRDSEQAYYIEQKIFL